MMKSMRIAVVTLAVLALTGIMSWAADRENYHVTRLYIGRDAKQVSGDSSQLLEKLACGTNSVRQIEFAGPNTAQYTQLLRDGFYTGIVVTAFQDVKTGSYYQWDIKGPNSSNETVVLARMVIAVDDNASNTEDTAWEYWVNIAGTLTKVLDMDASGASVAAGSIHGQHIAANSVSNNHIAASAVKASEIQSGCISNVHIAAGAGIQGAKLASGTVSNAQLAANIQGSKLVSGTVSNAQLAAGIEGGKLTSGTVSNAQIAAAAGIQGSKLASGTVANLQLAANIQGSKLVSGTVSNAQLAAGIEGGKLTSGTVSNAQIAAAAGITAGKLGFDPCISKDAGDRWEWTQDFTTTAGGTSLVVTLAYKPATTNWLWFSQPFYLDGGLPTGYTNGYISNYNTNNFIFAGYGGERVRVRISAKAP